MIVLGPDIEKSSHASSLTFMAENPFMSKKMWHPLTVAVDKGYSKDILFTLQYKRNTLVQEVNLEEFLRWLIRVLVLTV